MTPNYNLFYALVFQFHLQWREKRDVRAINIAAISHF
jgi:hypothetical protein